MTENPLSDALKRLTEEATLNAQQAQTNAQIAKESSELWLKEKTNIFMQTIRKVDEEFDKAIENILRSITND